MTENSSNTPRRRMPLSPVAAGNHPLSKEERRYLLKALRLRDGEKIEVFDGQGFFANATLREAEGDDPYLEVETPQEAPHPEHRLFVAVATRKATGLTGWSKKSPKSEPVVLSGFKPSAVSLPPSRAQRNLNAGPAWPRPRQGNPAASGFHKSRAP